jgi:hypothetical protein
MSELELSKADTKQAETKYAEILPPELEPPKPEVEERTAGPSLTLIYSLVALALLFAVSFAALIVLPFYRRR